MATPFIPIDQVLQVIRNNPNVCKNIHLPAQSGNSEILEKMRRGYTREAYLELVDHIRSLIPNIGLSSDFICGFSGETDEQFQDTLTLMEAVKYNFAYLFPYSLREKTHAHRKLTDDVAENVKKRRLVEMQTVFRSCAEKLNAAQVNQLQLVLVEGESKRSDADLAGRNERNTKVVFPKISLATGGKVPVPGDYVAVKRPEAGEMALARLSSVKLLCQLRPLVGAVRNAGHWNYEWQPGPYPKTPEERLAAAKKYNLEPEDYKPYPEGDRCLGDYPDLPPVSTDARDPFYPWDHDVYKINYGEALYKDYEAYGADRLSITVKPRFSYRKMWTTCIISIVSYFVIISYFDSFSYYPMPVMPRQFPDTGATHYTFEPATD
ncbi:unnamed protein product [Notodromas monacha]|uniref:Uncharacterized protein n=1 Tax=Notodromas monacha TaxID=399045 RepID=A0A7R9GD07_9CRUS|nr:unnamed protein product [Notodromas monacha]CAG0916651.1 unnamed protein product [Notodromas monacha]